MLHDHSSCTRRDLLRLGAALGLGSVAAPLMGAPAGDAIPGGKDWDRSVILIELDGGNDGLNTIVPFEDDQYYNLRPRLAIPKNDVIQLTTTLGLNPLLQPLKSAWDDDDLCIAMGLGYSNSNRSHFRGIDIWNTGADSNEFLDTGWFGRLIHPASPPSDIVGDAVLLKRYGSNPAERSDVTSLAMSSPSEFVEQAEDLTTTTASTGKVCLDHLLTLQNQVANAVGSIDTALTNSSGVGTTFPDTTLGKQLHSVAEMMVSGLRFPLYKLSFNGFDTHSGQAGRHAELMTELAAALAAFRTEMRSQGLWDDVMVCTYSEFGRRVKENGSAGTDHGSGAPHLIMGGRINGGILGSEPDLSASSLDANRGDVPPTDDFRRLYATAARFLGFSNSEITSAFGGTSFSALGCL
ncbi:MAG: DUF1501 domain-containing protein [Planctomycetota bacterium]|jgi:uncharacterized protein (DUF1501 family)|nr:DUF1501 domain-containing protein [Planctomycetota bacterium]